MRKAGIMLLAGALAAAAAMSASARGTDREQDLAFHSAALDGTLHYEVYLPADYDTSGVRYPVVYFLHGLPSGAAAYQGLGFVERALDLLQRRAILVVPQGARAGESDPEYLDLGPGHRWETAIARELPQVVDARFRTVGSRSGRALVGLSAGGYGAMHLALQHLDTFAAVESWSGYFRPTDPTGTSIRRLGSLAKDLHANVHAQARNKADRLRSNALFIGFYVGSGDTRFAAENEELNQELSRAGIPHTFRLYPGGHDTSLWSQYAQEWLGLALAHLAPAA